MPIGLQELPEDPETPIAVPVELLDEVSAAFVSTEMLDRMELLLPPSDRRHKEGQLIKRKREEGK